jgi:signal transduction histidine kinase
MLKRLENFGMMTKVVIPTCVMLTVALGIVLLAESGLGTLTAQTHEIINVTATRQALALAMSASANGVAASEKNAMLMTGKTGLDVFASAYVSEIDHLNDDVAQLKKLAVDPAETARLDRIGQAIDAYYATGQQLYDLMVDRRFDDAHVLSTGAAQDARERLIALIKDEVDRTAAEMQRADAEADALYQRTSRWLSALSVGGLLVAFLMVYWITTRFIVGPLTKITEAMGRISHGDLAVAIEEADRGDEIGVLGRALAVFRQRSLALRENSERLTTAHDEIRALNAVLEQRVEERTAALNAAHRDLLAQERLSSLGTLTATVAHELRNPLSTLRNTMHVIGRTVAERGVDIARQMGRCERTIDRCDGIISDLLDFAEAREIHTAATRLDSWLGEVLDGVAMPPTVELQRRLDAPRAVVALDNARLACAVVNVVDNAVEALAGIEGAEAGDLRERRITVSTRAAERAEIVIADTGPGMPESTLARVFEPLFSTHAFGTGLGLPTVKQILEQHGGTVEIVSTPGGGTRVALSLPLTSAKSGRAAA